MKNTFNRPKPGGKIVKNFSKPISSDEFKKGGKKLHLGFKEAQAKIAKKQGISMEAAGAILASSARKASPAAVKKNPALLNVKRGKVKKYGDGGKSKTKSNYSVKTEKGSSPYLYKDSYVSKTAKKFVDGKIIVQKNRKDISSKEKKGENSIFSPSYRKSTLVVDTTGYSKGKTEFPAKKVSTTKVPRTFDYFGTSPYIKQKSFKKVKMNRKGVENLFSDKDKKENKKVTTKMRKGGKKC